MERTFLNGLVEGGYIEAYSLDMQRGTITMRVDVLENDRLSSYDISFERVSRFTYDTEQSWFGSDYRLQVTELYVDEAPESSSSEEWQVTISVWDLAHLTIRCSTVLIDGEALQ